MAALHYRAAQGVGAGRMPEMTRSRDDITERVARGLPRRALMRGVSAGSAAAMLAAIGDRARAADAAPFP